MLLISRNASDIVETLPGLKPGLHISLKGRKHIVANTFSNNFTLMLLSSYSCSDRRYSYLCAQEIFAIDVLTALKSSLEQRRKHVLRLLRLYGDQALVTKYVQNSKICVVLHS